MLNPKLNLISFVILTALLIACDHKKDEASKKEATSFTSHYLGQTPPSLIPEPFAPGIVTTDNWEIGGVFTPDLKEFYFIREVGEKEEDKKQVFIVMQNLENEWQESIISPRVGQPFISPDGHTMHLGRRYKERTKSGEWSELKTLAPPFDNLPIMRLTSSAKNTYVFDAMGEGLIRYSNFINGQREAPKLFGPEINSGTANAHPFIAPDESFLLWDGRRDSGYGNADIYVSFRQEDGTFGEAINLGEKINTPASEAGARVTPDGKYLFFNRNVGKAKPTDKYDNSNMFWVDAQVIEILRPQ